MVCTFTSFYKIDSSYLKKHTGDDGSDTGYWFGRDLGCDFINTNNSCRDWIVNQTAKPDLEDR